MSELISHTPVWVFIVFFTLLVLGFIQTKERTVKVKTVFILPVAMIIFSFFGVYSVFGLSVAAIALWLLGLVIALVLGFKLGYPKHVSYSQQVEKLTISGSKIQLIFMMAIFFTKYFVGFAFARDLPLVNEFIFLVVICLFYGLFSGIFLSRSLVMFNVSKVSV
ncbi:hypothetical protein H4J38_03515 [Colwellia sp. BRX10-3]|uniref:DUF6622 family protein n=1 Tax=Colwellia sp. BRX10-3 TaxID=2759844 RepID=UPI0015F6BC9F|nr:DUF6622 family protein [Colwellia sp. BRX10-3]MBA6389844.1 hypothetical protein [Colwellia sp. BRX10-3]